jgi:DNA helicase II / ATP-dependent DNA helicase PcrA
VNAHTPFSMPPVLAEDVAWACSILGLPITAFSGPDGKDPRLEVIKSLDPLDVEACPGSGKTTLLVAKLAMLARHWAARRRGICVLSHTNVARREIEERLGSTPEGKRLLSYPHFVGTIHGFVNEFLAIPWIRSKPLPLRIIDDDTCLRRRWSKLPGNTRFGLQQRKYDHQILKIADTDYSPREINWGKSALSPSTETYQAIQAACQESCEEGFFCHDEMFVWARELLDRVPRMSEALRQRFPLLFIDEVQDTSEEQSALLFRIFMQGKHPTTRQRFGDSNQAIYQYSGQRDGAQTDPFPELNLRMPIPNSYRFGQQIANLADPLGLVPHGLVGLGPRTDVVSTDVGGKHAILLFDDVTVEEVLPCYAGYLIELFSVDELQRGTFTAVGAVHRPKDDDKIPRHVPHYWRDYDPDLASVEPRPRTFLQYLAVGRKLTRASGETYHVVDKIADGILRLASILNPLVDLSGRKRRHRYIRELLFDKPELDKVYLMVVANLMVGDVEVTPIEWMQTWAPRIMELASAIAGTPDTSQATAATVFLASQTAGSGDQQQTTASQRDNVYRFPSPNPKVQIRVGSIHSAKGETHTATLVLETYYRKHNLAALKSWLTGDKSGQGSEGPDNISRLKQHYVAMSRPSHLLCVAMREDSLSAGDIEKLKDRQWRIGRVANNRIAWL